MSISPTFRILAFFATFIFARCALAKGVLVPECDWKKSADFQLCLQTAIDKAASTGKNLEIPAGVWPISKALVLTAPLRITGNTRSTILIPTPDNNSSPLLLSGYLAHDIAVDHIVFDGGGRDFPNGNPVIRFTTSTHISISKIRVQHSRGIGLLMQGGINTSSVKDSVFADLGNHWKTTKQRTDRVQGVVFCCGNNSQNEAINNWFTDIGLDALQMANQSGFKVVRNIFQLENYQRSSIRSPDYGAAIFLLESKGGSILQNRIHGAQGNGIDSPGLQWSVIAYNLVTACGGAGIGIFRGYDGGTESHGIAIIGNTIMNNVQWGPNSVFRGGITIAGGEPSDISIESNIVHDSQLDKTQDYALMISAGTRVLHVNLKDNKFSNNRIADIYEPPNH